MSFFSSLVSFSFIISDIRSGVSFVIGVDRFGVFRHRYVHFVLLELSMSVLAYVFICHWRSPVSVSFSRH